MSTLTIQLPESLKKTIGALAAREGYSVSQFLARPKLPGRAGKGVPTPAAHRLNGAMSRSLASSQETEACGLASRVLEPPLDKSFSRIGQRPVIQTLVPLPLHAAVGIHTCPGAATRRMFLA